jgi:A/G-specific adenine glycosylase
MTRALIERNHCVYLVQRPADAAKMAGMWELPECAWPIAGQETEPDPRELCVVRHSITDTDYQVRVLRLPLKALAARDRRAGRWVSREEIFDLPLTGLTRKILRRQGIQPESV